MNVRTFLSEISGIGYSSAKKLERINLFTVMDLINHYPFRYDDFSNTVSTMDAKVGEKVTLQGEIWSISNIFTRSRKIITKAIFNDGTSPIELTWFNSSWLTKQIAVGDRLQISGKITKYGRKFSILMPQWEKLDSHQPSVVSHQTLHTGRLVPVYPETYGINSKWLRTRIAKLMPNILSEIKDPLPDEIRENMITLQAALSQIHFPKDYQEIEQARQRLGFDELFFIQLATLKVRADWSKKMSVKKLKVKSEKLKVFVKTLPFKLTKAQLRVTDEILDDLQKGIPMNRLVQGELGSGKTVVAAIAMYIAYLNGFRSLYMAPTEILAFQHFDTVKKFLEPYGTSVGIYTGSRKKVADKSDIVIGTHALLSNKLSTENVGLIIVDEQQRFGVEQRTLLRSKAKIPHFLTMTATPIPRTVALTIYGDLDLSIIDELPKGRPKISTHIVPENKRKDSYNFINTHVLNGEQVYVITPLIEESETLISAKAAKVEFEKLMKVFPDLKLGLLHGRLRSKEKENVINAFRKGSIDIMVSTSVVEVGMDIPNATIMVIEGAERFGLAQLHQLRGRIGRGIKESFCLLYTSDIKSKNRLKHLETTYDGLKLAELDLKIRGSGEIFGIRQSGRFELKIASFSDLTLIEKTRSATQKLLSKNPSLDKYPPLQAQLRNLAPNVMPD